jgi:hypothetical protein
MIKQRFPYGDGSFDHRKSFDNDEEDFDEESLDQEDC